ncbi:serine hydrolase domain-containing protein [Ornithinibacillus salinisoli]|uniref:Serine hydrolase domain-containing protein n=1 Tax=Ornithinibacillus salinisoli TaxID=1848459 RepID=A0ABW4W226_9BACI
MREKVLDFLKKEIELKHIPGAVLSVSHKGDVILQEALGNRVVLPEKAPMQMDTVFDLASLTKVVATLPAMLKLIDEGEIRLDDTVGHFLPDFAKVGKEEITLKQLLTHTSGLPAHKQYYADNLSTTAIFNRIYEQPLEYASGSKVVYSDLGLITLFNVIQQVTQQPFSDFVRDQFYKPLEMTNTMFNPSFERDRYAATEYSKSLNEYKSGIVHDDNTESMGGISGHAGLFSTIYDLQKFASMIENNGVYKGKQLLSETSLNLSRKNFTPFSTEHRGLGWILQSPEKSSCGDLFSENSYGHTGFTGTSIWFDPTVELHVILLTNRVHFGRQPHILRLRPRLHNIIRSYF